MYKVLIVEDDNIIANAIKKHLMRWEYDVRCVTDFGHVIDEFTSYNPHIVLMDISLPQYSGFFLCSQIRQISSVPVIFVSSMSDNMNIVMAVNMGGDDFISKPFELEVLTAKIQALLRRTYSFIEHTNIIECKGAILNINDMSFVYNNNRIELTKNEYRILKCLMEKKNEVVQRDEIIKKMWDDEAFIDDNTLTVNITRLRKKLDEAGLTDFIKTKKGAGYIVQ